MTLAVVLGWLSVASSWFSSLIVSFIDDLSVSLAFSSDVRRSTSALSAAIVSACSQTAMDSKFTCFVLLIRLRLCIITYHHHFWLALLWVRSATRNQQPPEGSDSEPCWLLQSMWDYETQGHLGLSSIIHVIRGRPGGLFQSSDGSAVRIFFASALSSNQAMCPSTNSNNGALKHLAYLACIRMIVSACD